jgi:chromosome segregation ATPase
LLYDILCGEYYSVALAVIDPTLDKAPISLCILQLVTKMANAACNKRLRSMVDLQRKSRHIWKEENTYASQNEDYRSDSAMKERRVHHTTNNVSFNTTSMGGMNGIGSPAHEEREHSLSATLSANLHQCRSEIAMLKDESAVLKDTLHAITYERDELRLKLSGEGGANLKTKDRATLRQALSEVADYEVYKDVMEGTFVRMKKDLEAYKADRDRIAAKLERQSLALRKEKSESLANAREVKRMKDFAKKEGDEREMLVNQVSTEQKTIAEIKRQNRMASKEIVKLRGLLIEQKNHKNQISLINSPSPIIPTRGAVIADNSELRIALAAAVVDQRQLM